MPTTHTPKFPVVDHSPEFGKVVSNMTGKEWIFAGALGAAGNVVGWLGGKFLLLLHYCTN